MKTRGTRHNFFDDARYQALEGYQTDWRILAAIEGVTGAYLGYDEYDQPTPAQRLWEDGGRDQDMRRWLNANIPDWVDHSPIYWGNEPFTPTDES